MAVQIITSYPGETPLSFGKKVDSIRIQGQEVYFAFEDYIGFLGNTQCFEPFIQGYRRFLKIKRECLIQTSKIEYREKTELSRF